MDPTWPVGGLVVAFVLARCVIAVRDGLRDTVSPYRPARIPEAGPEAWSYRGPCRTSVWGWWPGGRLTVAADWVGVSTLTLRGRRTFVADRSDVGTVVVVAGVAVGLTAGIGLVGPTGRSGIVVAGTNRAAAEAELDRLGWVHERRRGGILRPFA